MKFVAILFLFFFLFSFVAVNNEKENFTVTCPNAIKKVFLPDITIENKIKIITFYQRENLKLNRTDIFQMTEYLKNSEDELIVPLMKLLKFNASTFDIECYENLKSSLSEIFPSFASKEPRIVEEAVYALCCITNVLQTEKKLPDEYKDDSDCDNLILTHCKKYDDFFAYCLKNNRISLHTGSLQLDERAKRNREFYLYLLDRFAKQDIPKRLLCAILNYYLKGGYLGSATFRGEDINNLMETFPDDNELSILRNRLLSLVFHTTEKEALEYWEQNKNNKNIIADTLHRIIFDNSENWERRYRACAHLKFHYGTFIKCPVNILKQISELMKNKEEPLKLRKMAMSFIFSIYTNQIFEWPELGESMKPIVAETIKHIEADNDLRVYFEERLAMFFFFPEYEQTLMIDSPYLRQLKTKMVDKINEMLNVNTR